MRFQSDESIKTLLKGVLLQFIFCVVVFSNIQPLRAIGGFLYLTFIPGYIFLKLIKLPNLSQLQTLLFSSGLSLALLMLLGLSANEFGSLVGLSSILSSFPLMLVLNLFVFGELILYVRDGNVDLFSLDSFGNLGKTPAILLVLALPVLSAFGALLGDFNFNLVLMFVILIIAALMFICIISGKLFQTEHYPLIILSISLALLFHFSLISHYIHGFDIHAEYHIFTATLNNGYWNQIAFSSNLFLGRLNSLLSLTILPTFYANILNVDGSWVFKIVFPIIFSLVPLGLYEMWRYNFNKKIALLASFLFMSQVTFYSEMLSLERQMIAEFFFVLLLLLICNNKLQKSLGAKICFIIFSFCLIVSHYAIALIFLVFILSAWAFFSLTKRRSFGISLSVIGYFSIIFLAWGTFVSSGSIIESVNFFGAKVLSSMLIDFFNPASRGDVVLQGLGMAATSSSLSTLSRISAYLTEAFILVGSIVIMLRFWGKKSWFRGKRVPTIQTTKMYSFFSLAAIMMLGMCIVIPRLAGTLEMSRFYHMTLLLLAPVFVLGYETLTGFLVKRRSQLLASLVVGIIMISYFLFQTGFVYEVAKDTSSSSIPLSGYRLDPTQLSSFGLVEEVDVFGARWICKYADLSTTQFFADKYSASYELMSYGNIPYDETILLTNTTLVPSGGIIYLSKLNAIYGKISGAGGTWISSPYSTWNLSDLQINFSEINRVYSNGGCEIYIIP